MKDKLRAFYLMHKSGVWGAAIGLVAGILMITVGFFKTLFLILCVIAGFLVGKLYRSDTPAGRKLRGFFHLRGGDQ